MKRECDKMRLPPYINGGTLRLPPYINGGTLTLSRVNILGRKTLSVKPFWDQFESKRKNQQTREVEK